MSTYMIVLQPPIIFHNDDVVIAGIANLTLWWPFPSKNQPAMK